MQLSEEQQKAIDLCSDVSNRIVCVTGQAGTGKTTILREVHKNLTEHYGRTPSQEEPTVMLAAPTGRAAKRIEEATNIEARTIHRLLRYTSPEVQDDDTEITYPRKDKRNPLIQDAILIDEASMIDEELWRGVVDALKRGAIIRFFGDINQLPPVASTTSPFAAAMKKFPTSILTHNYRSNDGIIEVSDKIIRDRIPRSNDKASIFRIKQGEQFYHIKEICDSHEGNFCDLKSQIIAPTQNTKAGCVPINNFIQQRYNKEVEKILVYEVFDGKTTAKSFKRGDKVLWTKNDYNLEIMNGTLGIVQGFDIDNGSIKVTFDGNRDVEIPASMETFNPTTGEKYRYDPRKNLVLGYAITTHKSQGSQFDTVLYVLSNSRAATRQNVYTAVTRAKNNLMILNIAGCLAKALMNVAKL